MNDRARFGGPQTPLVGHPNGDPGDGIEDFRPGAANGHNGNGTANGHHFADLDGIVEAYGHQDRDQNGIPAFLRGDGVLDVSDWQDAAKLAGVVTLLGLAARAAWSHRWVRVSADVALVAGAVLVWVVW